jgi:hypothetical protein
MGPILSFRISCESSVCWLKRGIERLLGLISYSGITAAVILVAVGIAQAKNNKSTVGMGQIAKSAKQSPKLHQGKKGNIPKIIEATGSFSDSTGAISTFLPGGSIHTKNNPFFSTSITSNGRSCFTCHVPQNGWAISPSQIRSIYQTSLGSDPLFQPIDSANCPDAPGATNLTRGQFLSAHSQLFKRANFRISLNAPNPLGPSSVTTTFDGSTPQWIMTVISDPTGCENDTTYGLPAGLASVYRRPLPTANVAFLNPGGAGPGSNIMWDSREPNSTGRPRPVRVIPLRPQALYFNRACLPHSHKVVWRAT